jgi:hypothetical protein
LKNISGGAIQINVKHNKKSALELVLEKIIVEKKYLAMIEKIN